MSKIDDQKRYITLEDVRVSYKKKDDSIHLTSSDPDVAVDGFHMFLTKGTHSEVVLRKLLEDAGIIRNFQASAIEVGPLSGVKRNANKGTIVSVTSPKGGTGKTNIALNLAIQLSKFTNPMTGEKLKVVIADFDSFDGQISSLIGRTEPNVLNYLSNDERSTDSLLKSLARNDDLGIWALLTAPTRASIVESHYTTEFYTEILEKLSDNFDIVIVDSANNSRVRKATLPISDSILCVNLPIKSSADSLVKWADELQAEKVDMGKVSFILNTVLENAHAEGAVKLFSSCIKDFKTPVAVLPISMNLMNIDGPEERAALLNTKNDYTVSLIKLAKKVASL